MIRKILFALSFLVMISFGISNVLAAPVIIEFELEIELKDNTKFDMEYEVRGDMFEAEYQVPGSPTLYGEDAKSMIDALLKQLELTPDMNKKDVKKKILTTFDIDNSNVDEFELEVRFSDGKRLKINN